MGFTSHPQHPPAPCASTSWKKLQTASVPTGSTAFPQMIREQWKTKAVLGKSLLPIQYFLLRCGFPGPPPNSLTGFCQSLSQDPLPQHTPYILDSPRCCSQASPPQRHALSMLSHSCGFHHLFSAHEFQRSPQPSPVPTSFSQCIHSPSGHFQRHFKPTSPQIELCRPHFCQFHLPRGSPMIHQDSQARAFAPPSTSPFTSN